MIVLICIDATLIILSLCLDLACVIKKKIVYSCTVIYFLLLGTKFVNPLGGYPPDIWELELQITKGKATSCQFLSKGANLK